MGSVTRRRKRELPSRLRITPVPTAITDTELLLRATVLLLLKATALLLPRATPLLLPSNNTELLLLRATVVLPLLRVTVRPLLSNTARLLLNSPTVLLLLSPATSLLPIVLLCLRAGLPSSTRTPSDGTTLSRPPAAPSGRLLRRSTLPLLLLPILVLPTSRILLMDLVTSVVPPVDMVLPLPVVTVLPRLTALLVPPRPMVLLAVTDRLLQVATDHQLLVATALPPHMALLALLLLTVLLLPTALLADTTNMVLPVRRVSAVPTPTDSKLEKRRRATPVCSLVPPVVSLLVL